MTHFCFRLGLGAGVAAVGLFAAGLPVRPQHITRVVRADPRTGRLVRSVIVSSQPVAARTVAETVVAARAVPMEAPAPAAESAPAPNPGSLDEAVEQIAAEHSLLPLLIHSVIKVESNYNPFAVSPKGAMGLMQLMPETARRFGVPDVFNPIDNIRGGAKYLRYLLDLYGEDYQLALAAYNAGERAVEKYGTVPPYPETQTYVFLVSREIAQALKAVGKAAKAATQAAMPVPPAETTHIQETQGPDGIVRYVLR